MQLSLSRIPVVCFLIGSVITLPARPAEPANHQLARELLAELVAVNTAPSGGNDMRQAVDLLVRHLVDGGFDRDDIHVLGRTEKLANLVVRYRSEQPRAKPLLLMAHLDVVEALKEDWTFEPFALTEQDGWLYGRGTNDNKAGAAMLIANFIRLKEEGFRPDRDLVVMLTADEESSSDAVKWLLAEHRALIDAEFALNTDGGAVQVIGGEPLAFTIQTSEKVYVSYRFEARDPGGHSSRPHRDSAISRLSRTLVDLEEYDFPIDLNETTHAFFERWRSIAPAADRPLIDAVLADEPDAALLDSYYYNAVARTTCVATLLAGGHAENALPQMARADVNCRVLPQASIDDVQRVLSGIAAPYGVTVVEIRTPTPSPPSPLEPAIVGPIGELAESMWPGIVVIPEMSTGATDGLYVRNAGIPVYAVSAIADDPDDARAHGQDERVGVEAYRDATEYWYEIVKAFAR